jgi:hypothetical protein
MQVRYCEDCDETYRPDIELCSDCGGPLKEMSEEEADAQGQPPAEPPEAPYPPGRYQVIADSVSVAVAESVARELAARGIPAKVDGAGRLELRLSVREEEMSAALAVLIEAGLLPTPEGASARPVSEAGGPCPSCGGPVEAGSIECPTCGLVLGGDLIACERCGATILPLSQCKECGTWHSDK